MNKKTTDTAKQENRDPITGTPGAHPVGTGVGAASGGAAGAAIGAIGGPVGAGVGLVAGAVAGGYAGKGVAEAVDPTREDAYWRRHYSNRPYYRAGKTYADYESAYRTGWEGYDRHRTNKRRFDEVEPELKGTYEKLRSRMDWTDARPAVRDAWLRLEHNLEHLIDFTVVDKDSNRIGTVESVWEDHTGQPAFLGVRTGWLGLGKIHVLPAQFAEVSEDTRKIRVPFSEDVLRNSPSFGSESDFDAMAEDKAWRYYETHGFKKSQPVMERETPIADRGTKAPGRQTTAERTSIQLKEEEVKIGKREVEYGSVRLRKVVRSEVVQQPIELMREEIVIERVPTTETQPTGESFEEQEIYVPLRREEPVVAKEVKVREEVRIGKKSEAEQREVSETVRKEDVEIVEDSRGRQKR